MHLSFFVFLDKVAFVSLILLKCVFTSVRCVDDAVVRDAQFVQAVCAALSRSDQPLRFTELVALSAANMAASGMGDCCQCCCCCCCSCVILFILCNFLMLLLSLYVLILF